MIAVTPSPRPTSRDPGSQALWLGRGGGPRSPHKLRHRREPAPVERGVATARHRLSPSREKLTRAAGEQRESRMTGMRDRPLPRIHSRPQHAGDHAPGEDPRAWRLEAMTNDGGGHDCDCADDCDHDDD